MECLGGNGYVEESILPRLYREAPVNAIWEGSGNVMCLDVLRALKREEEAELVAALARDAGIDAASYANPPARPMRAPRSGSCALLACAVALQASAPAAVAQAFIRTRLATTHGALYGAATIDAATAELLLQRVLPGSVRTLTSGICGASRSSAPCRM